MSILSAIKQESNSLQDLAKLPQTMIMQMAQNGQISKEMVAPILGKKAEMADAAARMRAMQQGGQQQSVMEQIMQRNAQGENPIPQIQNNMEEAGVAQIPVREPQYAGGGIVAFAGGGMYDREAEEGQESEAQEMARLFPKSKLGELVDSGMSGLRSLVSKFKGSPTATPPAAENIKTRGTHPYEADAIKAAKQVGLDPNIMLHALYKETGGTKDPATAKSRAGAYGPMQLMPGTAKELGVDRTDPYQNILGGATYLKQQVDKFQDPSLALAAYNAGPGAVRRALASAQGLAALPRETQGYMKYAEGGEVKGYSGEDGVSLVDADYQSNKDNYYPENNPYLARSRAMNEQLKRLGTAFTTPRNYDPISKLVLDPLDALRKWGQTSKEEQAERFNRASNARKNVSMTDVSEPKVTPKPTAEKPTPLKSDLTKNDAKQVSTDTSSTYGIKPTRVTATPEKAPVISDMMDSPARRADQDYADALMRQIEAGREESKAAREENRGLALLQAGLGMMGGTSPYAMANIGAGAMQGVQSYAQGQKGIREQERDLMSAQLGLYKYKSAAENAAAERQATAAYRDAVLGQKGEGAENLQSDRAYTRLQQIEKDIASRVINQYKDNPMYKMDPNKFTAEIESKIMALKQRDQLYNSLYQRAMGAAPDFGPVAPAPGNRPPLGSFQTK